MIYDKGNYIQWYQKGYREHDTRAWKVEKVCETLIAKGGTKIMENNLRIRKLTPKECGRLMAVKDEDIDKVSQHLSNASLYHIFGDSICCNVLMAIFGQMVDGNWEEYFNPKEWWSNENI